MEKLELWFSSLMGIKYKKHCFLFQTIFFSFGEHLVPYYSELAEKGCSQGFLVFGHDLVGHGFSEGL